MPRTSNKADLILDYVNQFIQHNGYAPSVREIGAAVGLRSTASVSYHLQALQERGLLQAPKAKGVKRAIVTTQRPGQIPVFDTLPIAENQTGTLAWEGDPSCFALHVRDNSMTGACILCGDKVVVLPCQEAEDGQIVLVRTADEAIVRRLHCDNGHFLFLPENGRCRTIDGAQAELIGTVKAVIREY